MSIDENITRRIQELANPGDIIFLGGNDIIAKLIEYGQKTQTPDRKPSLWSHVCIVVNKDLIIESTLGFEKFRYGSRWDNGVQYYPLEQRIKSSAWNCDLIKVPLSKKQRSNVLAEGENLYEENIRYPILGLLGSLLTYRLFPYWKSNPLDNPKRKLYCSAFVAKCFSAVGITFSHQYNIDNISPQILYDGCSKYTRISLARQGKEVFDETIKI